jgi:hypothetical protein
MLYETEFRYLDLYRLSQNIKKDIALNNTDWDLWVTSQV